MNHNWIAGRTARLSLLAGCLVALSLWTSPADAGILGAIAKAAKAAGKAGKAGKAAKGASAAGKATKAGALVAGGTALAAERSATLFKLVPDDAGRVAAYLAREPDGAFRVVSRSGEQAVHAPGELGPALGKMATPETPKLDVYADLSAAKEPSRLAPPSEHQRLFVLDRNAQPRRVRVAERKDGTLEYLVDGADGAVELSDFACAELESEEETDRAGTDNRVVVAGGLLSGVVLLGLFGLYLRDRRRRGLSAT